MPVNTSVEETVKKVVTKIVRKSEADFASATSFKDLDADSLDIVQILVALEDTYDIEIQDEELQAVDDLAGFIAYIERKVAEKG